MTRRPSARRGRVTIQQVAAAASVDPSVVSRVLSNDERLRVRDETRQRVLDAVERLRYRPNAVARTLRTARAGAYGLLIPEFSNPVYAAIVEGAETAAAERRAMLLTSSVRGPQGVERFLDLIGNERVDGVLIADARAGWPLVQPLTELGVPYLLLNQRTANVDRSLVLDDAAAARVAVEHLLDLGHRRIGHLAGAADADTAQRRRAGYVEALEDAGVAVDEALVVPADYTLEGGDRAIRRLLAVEPRPTAVFAANVASAIGCLHGAAEVGFDVPGDLSVVAMHDMPLAKYLRPSLTTVTLPLEELGRRGLELLATQPPRARIELTVTGDVRLIKRASTARVRGAPGDRRG